MGSAGQTRKRAFVKVLLRLAALYKFVCGVNRDSTDAQVESAFRKVAAKCHPDKGGDPEHAKELHAARDEWKKGPRATSNTGDDAEATVGVPVAPGKGFRIHLTAVLLTYNRIKDLAHWEQFLKFFEGNLRKWHVRHWCATACSSQKKKEVSASVCCAPRA